MDPAQRYLRNRLFNFPRPDALGKQPMNDAPRFIIDRQVPAILNKLMAARRDTLSIATAVPLPVTPAAVSNNIIAATFRTAYTAILHSYPLKQFAIGTPAPCRRSSNNIHSA